jgi:hypothetical protein
LKSQPNSPWENAIVVYASNEKKYMKYLDFIIGWDRSWTEDIESDEEYVESFKRFEEFMGRRTTAEVLGAERRFLQIEYVHIQSDVHTPSF